MDKKPAKKTKGLKKAKKLQANKPLLRAGTPIEPLMALKGKVV